MRLLVADRFSEDHLGVLRSTGHDVRYEPGLSTADLPAAVPGRDVLVVRSTRVDAATIAAGDRLALVLRAGAGVNTIDVAAAAAAGVYVCNVPGRNADAVAELTIGLMVAVDRRIADATADLRAGRWNKATYQQAAGLKGRVLAVVGVGAIGLGVAERAHALGMSVHVLARPGRDAATTRRLAAVHAVEHADLASLAGACDVITFHVPATADTIGMVDAELLRHLRPGAVVINTSRGDVVDEAALLTAIEEKGLRAGLDVFADEPSGGEGAFHSVLAAHPAVTGTHHIGASTDQAQEAIAVETLAILRDFDRGVVRNCVNLDTSDRGTGTLVVRHFNRVGVLASVLRRLSEAGINVEQMDNEIFTGGEAACATIHVAGDIDEAVRRDIAAADHVIGAVVTAKGRFP